MGYKKYKLYILTIIVMLVCITGYSVEVKAKSVIDQTSPIVKNPLKKDDFDDLFNGNIVKPPSNLDEILESVGDSSKNVLPPKGYYILTKNNGIKDYKGKIQSGQFTKIKLGKHEQLTEVVKEQAKKNFKKREIDGSLLYESKKNNMWTMAQSDDKLNFLYRKKSDTKLLVSDGKTDYKIWIPEPDSDLPVMAVDNASAVAITLAIAQIESYQKAVKDAITFESVNNTYTVYNMYPDKQVLLTDMQVADVKDGKNAGTWSSIPPKNGAVIQYNVSKGVNPIFGSFTPEDIKAIGSTIESHNKFWRAKRDEMKIKVEAKTKSNITYPLSKDWGSFANLLKGSSLTDIKDEQKDKGFLGYKSAINKKKASVKGKIDSTTYFAVPKIFKRKASTDTYAIENKDTAFKILNNVKLDLTKHKVLSFEDGDTQVLGDFENYGLESKYLAFSSTIVSKDDKKLGLTKGQKVGSVVSLRYKEGVYAPETASRQKFYTGRNVIFANDYNNKIEIDVANKSILSVVSADTGKIGIEINKFAFASKMDYKDAKAHKDIGDKPESFELRIEFEDEADMRGFIIYRNNAHLNDKILLNWLKTKEAKAMTDVYAKELYDLITGKIITENKKLTYKEWDRLQEMKAELEESPLKKVRAIITTVLIIFGYLICIYSVLLVCVWLLDIVGSEPFGFSLFHFMTVKRMYPVNDTLAEYEYKSSSSDYIPITRGKMILLFFIVLSIGLVFIAVNPITKCIAIIYLWITQLTGVG